MQFFYDRQTFLKIGILSIRYYALFIVTGALIAYYFIRKEAKKAGYDNEVVENYFYGTFILGILGARIWYCLFFYPSYYFANPLEILKIWTGGLAIQGGIMAGALFTYFYTKHYRISFMRLADIVLPNVLIAQSLGRWGNFMNQEAHGNVVSESYFNGWPAFIKNGMQINGLFYAPTFLYESLGTLSGWLIITFVLKKQKIKRGQAAGAYLMWYGVVRFFVEGMRTDSLMFMNLRVAQLLAILGLLIGLALYIGLFDKFMVNKPLVIFDLDGTLLDTRDLIINTYKELFIKYQSEEAFTKEIQLEVLGPSLKTIFDKYFEEDSDKLIKEYRKLNHELHDEYCKMVPNCQLVLDDLKSKGYRMAIVSTKASDSVNLGLKQFDLQAYFEVILGSDNYNKLKPNKEGLIVACDLMKLSKDNAIYIGDSKTDIMAAKNAGIYSIAFLLNEDRKEDLISANANKYINDLKEITDILDGGNKIYSSSLR